MYKEQACQAGLLCLRTARVLIVRTLVECDSKVKRTPIGQRWMVIKPFINQPIIDQSSCVLGLALVDL